MAYFYPTYQDLQRERASEDVIDTIEGFYAINEKQYKAILEEKHGILEEAWIKREE